VSNEGAGIGFAIPVNSVKKVVPQLIEKGYVSRPWLGIRGQSIDVNVAAALGFKSAGVLVADVFRSSPADNAGFKGSDRAVRFGNFIVSAGGDFIVAVDNVPVKSMDEFNEVIDRSGIGAEVTITVVRDAKTINFKITLVEMPRGN
jgi:S1-C subfamily serine protease